MSGREIKDRLRRMGEGEAAEPGGPTPFAAVQERVERRRRNRLVGVAAAVGVAVALPLGWAAFVGGGGASTDTATEIDRPACPGSLPKTADPRETALQLPSTSGAEAGRLVPDGAVVAVTVCRYDGPYRGRSLEGERRLTGDLDAMVADLREVSPRPAIPKAGCLTRGTNAPHLTRVDYEDGHAWVVAGGNCENASRSGQNGTELFDELGWPMGEAYDEGVWPGMQGTDCEEGAVLRRDLRTQMLPEEEPTSVHVCSSTGPDEGTPVDDVSGVMDALRSAADEGRAAGRSDPMDNPRCPPNAQVLITEVHLRYETGPDVEVKVAPACTPEVSTAGGGADLTPELEEALDLEPVSGAG